MVYMETINDRRESKYVSLISNNVRRKQDKRQIKTIIKNETPFRIAHFLSANCSMLEIKFTP